MGTPVVWEGNVGNAAEHRSFANGNKDPRHMLRLNVMFDNSIPDGQGSYKDRGGFWANVEWWHQDAERFAALFQKGMRVVVIGRAIMDTWTDKQSGQEVSALKVEASRVAILPHRVEQIRLAPPRSGDQRPANQQQTGQSQGQGQGQGQGQAQNNRGPDQRPPQPMPEGMQDYPGFDEEPF
ncbi:single-stranded DNA-binding protein [Pseudomonas oryziphila]|uniref:Single-stranded DNA-binding protein n=1 Tax=Pseudomonas entomophila TaxID=312306 RepID=A0A3S8UP84_9PSED|nr:single-stranded DNA-binding protein [Pseudomonas oryziphila]AZL70077.1 single-stranded DNA-binding protein [Pseudomonas oryziphila]